MNIVPRLNLNKHPQEVKDGSLIDGTNLIISKDTAVVQTEPILEDNNIVYKINTVLETIGGNINYNIIYTIPCNKEIVIFCQDKIDESLVRIFRYNEETDTIQHSTTIEYSGGQLLGEFTYNHNELIIAISEYFNDDSKKIPLKVINLGKFGEVIHQSNLEQLINSALQPICPEVKISMVNLSYKYGIAYKGWYYVFIRYKIGTDTYTQWFDTNANIFIDNYSNNYFFNYWISEEVEGMDSSYHSYADINISDSTEISSMSFNVNVQHTTNLYKYFQLGFVCVSKSYTHCYKTSDLSIEASNTLDFHFSRSTVEDYSVNDLITTYYNYYNAKAITVNNNRLYIGNYQENNKESELIDICKNIDLTISMERTSISNIIERYKSITEQVLNTNGVFPMTYYNIFVHFVDKYGAVTKGINIGEFNLTTNNGLTTTVNSLGNTLLYVPLNYNFTTEFISYLSAKLNTIPNNYSGYYFSYEKIESCVKYFGIGINESLSGSISIFTDKLNYDDSIDLDFDTVRVFTDTEWENGDDGINYAYLNRTYTIPDNITNPNYIDEPIINKTILVADAYNNIGASTKLRLTTEDTSFNYDHNICLLYKNTNEFYNQKNKTLIPCSSIYYNAGATVYININNCFTSYNHAVAFNEQYYYNESVKLFQQQGLTGAITKPMYNYVFYAPIEVPMESLQFNNIPVVTFFPMRGLNTTNENEKSFNIGCIVEAKNTVDLYQQKHHPVYEAYPKTLDWYDEDILYTNDFTKTIRRSNVIQDESNEVAWRKFETEAYKIITENKGNIIKLISIGYYFIAHTQHSMFLFNATDTIESKENGIQLASVDIWDIAYKEVITSSLGFAGIQKEYNGIVGEFGYIFYDADAKRIYRYDDNSIQYIDDDIVNFIYKLTGYDVYLVDDKLRDRILFRFFKNGVEDIIISYNYKSNTFVSRHLYEYFRGWSTKERTYIISKFTDDTIYNTIYEYSKENYCDSTISIMINTDYYLMKYIEFIRYNISKIEQMLFNNYSPVEGTSMHYAGDLIKVYSAKCDTGDIDITFEDPENTINRVMDYTKPYWRFGNWHFNMLRNKLTDYIEGTITAEESSRIYGNWFVIMFTCYGNKQVEFESIIPELISAETK